MFLLNLVFRDRERSHCEFGRPGCENLTENHAVSRCCWVLPLFALCLLCVKTSHEERGAAILRCYSSHTLPVALLVKTNLLVCQKNWDIGCISVVGWLVLLLFLLTCKQWHNGRLGNSCSIIVFTGPLCVHDSHLTTRGRSTTAQWAHHYCDHLQSIMLSFHLLLVSLIISWICFSLL